MTFSDTIFALSTASGKSGVAIIRISGAEVLSAAKALGVASLPAPRYAEFKRFYNRDDALLDEGLILYFKAPHSFTGEDVLELHLHGSRATIRSMLEYLGTIPGLRLAEPGEFSRRALAHHKMDLTQAEGLADLIDAETTAQQQLALAQMHGALSRTYMRWREQVIEHMAYLEAFIDFPEEEIPDDVMQRMLASVHRLTRNMQQHLANKSGKRIREGVYIAILGKPNVGKSSLLNRLAEKEAAIVSEQAGTTRDIIEVHMDIAGYPVILCDTAGLRASEDKIEQEGVKRALARAEQADLSVYVMVGDEALSPQIPDDAMVVYNKTDINPLPASLKRERPGVISVSAKTGDQITTLIEAIKARILSLADAGNSALLTRERHILLVGETVQHLEQFLSEAGHDKPVELMAEDLRLAAVSLGKLTGAIDVEEMLDSLFSSFCIGK